MRPIALLVLTFVALTAAPAESHHSPNLCTGDKLQVVLSRDKPSVENGDVVTFKVRVGNDAANACDVSGASVTVKLPAADGTASGQTLTYGPPATFLSGTALADYVSAPYTVHVNPGVQTITAAVTMTYVVHGAADAGAQFTGTVVAAVTHPLTLSATVDPSSGIVPFTAVYDYVLTNTRAGAITSPAITGAGCGPLVRGAGDVDGDDQLDGGEAWHYGCSKLVTIAGTSSATAVATGGAGTFQAYAASAGVVVTGLAPPRPRLTLTKTATPASGVVPFTVVYTYEVVNDSEAGARDASDVTVTDAGCAPVLATHSDALLSRGERWTFACSLLLTSAGSAFSSAVATGTDTFDGQQVSSEAAGAGVAATTGDLPPAIFPDEATPTPTPTPAVKRPSTRVSFPVNARFARPCTGRVALTLKAGSTVVARKTVKPDRTCRYKTRFDVLRSRLRGARSVTVTARLGKRTVTRRLPTPV